MREIKKIYLADTLSGLANVSSVILTLYLLSHGFHQIQIAQLVAFFMIFLAVFDIPTGELADIFGYKLSVAIGIFLQALCDLIFFFTLPLSDFLSACS